MNSPVFSVVIPTYNRALVLKRAVESVVKQTFQNWELIIVDDGSDDHTLAVLEAYQSNHKIKIFSTANQGVSKARNLAAKSAQGEWLAFLDSDDEWLPEKLLHQHQYIQKNLDVKLVHSEETWIRNGVRVNPAKKHKKGGGNQFFSSLRVCAIGPSTTAIKKDVFFELGGFREDFPVCEDYDLWLKFTSLYPAGFIQKPLARKYGGHEDQLSTKYKAMDYWRVKSLVWILENRVLSEEEKQAACESLTGKMKVLINGYKKRGNLERLKEMEKIQKSAVLADFQV